MKVGSKIISSVKKVNVTSRKIGRMSNKINQIGCLQGNWVTNCYRMFWIPK